MKEQRTVKVGAVTCSFSDFTFGKQFTYDYCPDVGYYSFNVADKDNVYILTSMTMSTKKNSAEVPSIDVYEIKGGKAYLETPFLHDYATWTNYGCYLGTYHDESHDFSKVNSVKYKLAAEISKELAKKPLIILTSKDGSHFSHELTIDEVVKNYYVLKFINRNKL